MTMIDAMTESLRLLSDGLGGKRVDEGRIRAYLRAVREDDLLPDDVTKAADWFNEAGDGRFPEAPVFRRRCQIERSARVGRERTMAYRAQLEEAEDPYANPDDWVTREEAHRILSAAIARIDTKFTAGTERAKSRRDLDKEIRTMRGVA